MIAKSQTFLRALAIGLALACGACAKGASTFDDTINGSSGSGASTTCGNGVIDLNNSEQCEPNLPLPATATCALLMAGTGTVSCSRVTCRFDTSMCSAGTGVAGAGH